ncbi:MAG: hypothetical protein JWN50_749 [Parcubacteria group bacterium]|nr:hypothetical protein [Parcubacteria group bacterium]
MSSDILKQEDTLQTQFTDHASARVWKRLHISRLEVARILEDDQCILLGKDGASSKIHKLFFSALDDDWFVAVQDERSGVVVTVLPSNYHNRWHISPEALQLARKLIEKDGEHVPSLTIANAVGVMSFWFTAIFEDSRGIRRTVNLGSIPREGETTILRVMADTDVRDLVKDWLSQKIATGERPVEVLVRLGKKGVRTPVDLRSLGW